MTTPPPLVHLSSFEVDMDKSEVCLVYSVRRSGWSSKYIVIHQSSSQISATATLFWSNGENKGEKSRSSTKKATVSLPRWAHSSFHLPTLKLGKGPAQGSWWEKWTLGEMRRPSGFSTGGTLGQWRRRGRSKNTGGSRVQTLFFQPV